MPEQRKAFESDGRAIANHERAIQREVDAGEARSFAGGGDDAPPQTGARSYTIPPLPQIGGY